AALAAELADEAAVEAARRRAEEEVRRAAAAEDAAERALREAGAAHDAAQEGWYALAALRERVSTTLSIASERMRLGEAAPTLDAGGREPEALGRAAAEVRAREADLARRVEAAHAALTDATLRRNPAEAEHAAAEQAYAAALRAVADR